MGGQKKTKGVLIVLSVVVTIVFFMTGQAPIDFESCFQLLVTILIMWIALPLMKLRDYVRLPSEDTPNTTGLKRPKWVLALITIGLAMACAKNLADEMYMQPDFAGIGIILLLWLSIPMLNFFVGLRTRNRKVLRITLVVATYYLMWMLLYALNGSTRGSMGAEHMHIYLAPFAMVMWSPIVLYGEFCLRRFERWLALRSKQAQIENEKAMDPDTGA